jgi:hypothetical protein
MLSDAVRKKFENIVRGVIIEGQTDFVTTIRNYLCAGFNTSKKVKRDFESQLIVKEKQAAVLRDYANSNHLYLTELPPQNNFLARGGESVVYLDTDQRHVVKVNDCVYYATWLEYFNSLALHNCLFEDTAYTFVGFADIDGALHGVVRQLFIHADGQADLNDIRTFLLYNGFANTKRQDYFNQEYGIILEEMHDENVIVNSDKLFFIDTVFYTVEV